MKPNYSLCDACGRKIPVGMEFISESTTEDSPDYWDSETKELTPAPPVEAKIRKWELCHKCMVTLVESILTSGDAKFKRSIDNKIVELIQNHK